MPHPRLPIASHLTSDEIARRYRECRDGLVKTHWQVLWLMTRPGNPLSPAAAAEHVGMSATWVRSLLKRYNRHGPDGLLDRRKATNGAKPKLTAEQRAELLAAVGGVPPDGGLWSGPKVAAWVADRFGIRVCKQTGWLWLRQLGMTRQVPRPVNPGAATEDQQRAWKRCHGSVGSRAAPSAGRAVP